jgi:hypothetical protein
MTRKMHISLLAFTLLFFAACSKSDIAHANGNTNNENMDAQILSLPTEPLSVTEKTSLLHMREEEKLARDVYNALYQKWGMQVFSNIASSEQTHMDAILTLLNKYNLKDPVANLQPGEFNDPALQSLYTRLVADGLQSTIAALKVGATIEDLDLFDLAEAIEASDNQDIDFVYGNLAKGSRNHMRAFNSNLKNNGVVYVPQFISQASFDAIINSAQERGR